MIPLPARPSGERSGWGEWWCRLWYPTVGVPAMTLPVWLGVGALHPRLPVSASRVSTAVSGPLSSCDLHGRRDSNSQPSVLETDALAS